MNALTITEAPRVNFPELSSDRPVTAAVEVKPPRRRSPWKKILAVTALATVAGAGIAAYLHHAAGFESTDDAFLSGDVHPVSPRINGTVLRVLVDDNAHVTAGQPLIELDPADARLAVQGAEADLAQAQANVAQTDAQIDQARAEIAAAAARIEQNTAQLTRAELDFHRMETLAAAAVRAVPLSDFDNARATFDAAKADRQSLIAQRAATEAGLTAAQARRAVAQAQVQKAAAALAIAKLQADYTIILAPSSGRIAKKNVEAGQRLQPGQPVLAVVDDDVWVVANFKENQLARLRVGQPVEINVDALESRSFTGTVQSFAPGTGAAFSLLPPDNATGNFTKIVQRVPVKIVFAPGSAGAAAARLSPGLSAVVKVSLRK